MEGKSGVKVVFRNIWVVIVVLCVLTLKGKLLCLRTHLRPNSAALFDLRDLQKDFEMTVTQSEMLRV